MNTVTNQLRKEIENRANKEIDLISIEDAESIARQLIDSFDNGEAMEFGNRTSDCYVPIGTEKGNAENKIAIGLTEYKNFDEENVTPYYSLHVINDISFADCYTYQSTDLSDESLVAMLKTAIKDIAIEQACADCLNLIEETKGFGSTEKMCAYLGGFHYEENDNVAQFDCNYKSINTTVYFDILTKAAKIGDVEVWNNSTSELVATATGYEDLSSQLDKSSPFKELDAPRKGKDNIERD